MQYRKDPVTGDWIIIPHCINPTEKPDFAYYQTELFLPDCAKDDILTFDDGFVYTFETTALQIQRLFIRYLEEIKRLKQNAVEIFIGNILKPHCREESGKKPSQIYVAPAKEEFYGRTIGYARDYFSKTGKCLWCAVIENEIQLAQRTVLVNNGFAAIQPFASRFPFETMIIPIGHSYSFDRIPEKKISSLSGFCHTLLRALSISSDNADFSLNIYYAAMPVCCSKYLHWNIQLIPWLNNWAGFEIATGMNINITTPESCGSAILKNV